MHAGKLNWTGFASLPVPAIVKHRCQDSEIEIHSGDLDELPHPLNSASCWIFCREAWPHQDPDFHQQAFITLVIQGDHRYGQLIRGDKFKEVSAFPGTLLTTDPMAMHWLAPNNPDNNPGFIGLQWEVKRCNLEAKLEELKAALGELGTVNGCAIKATPTVLSHPIPFETDPLV